MNSHTSTIYPNIMPSTILSKTDLNFIEFARCLYKAKLVVQELEEFIETVGPTLCLSPYDQKQQYDPRISTDDFIKHVNQYLEESFSKFNNMCNVLLLILKNLEVNHPLKKERIDSFKYEVLNELKKVNIIKHNLQESYANQSLPSPLSNDSSTYSISSSPPLL